MVFSTIDVTGPLFGAVADLGSKVQPIADPWSDQQTPSPNCASNLGMNTTSAPPVISMRQGEDFTRLFPAQRGGKMTHRRTSHIVKHKKNNRKTHRKNLKQRGGSAPFPDVFNQRLPADLVGQSGTASLDKAMADLPQFAGSYGLQQGGRRSSRNNRRSSRKNSRKASKKNSRKASKKNSRKASRKANRKNSRKNSRKANRKNNRKASRKNRKNSRKNNRRQDGGAYGDDAMSIPESSKLLLSPEMEQFAHVNPQFYNENIINPNFQAPYSAYIQSQIDAQQ